MVNVSQIRTAPHECKGYLTLAEYGLDPYWALTRLLIEDYDGHGEIDVEINGETWEVEFAYQKSGFAPRETDPINAERLYEPRILAYGNGERKATYNLSPRFEDMRHYETGERLPQPFNSIDPDEGLSVHFQGSNLEPQRYKDLLPVFVDALAEEAGTRMREGYFGQPAHPMSTIYEYERYVRLTRSMNQKLIGQGGVMQKLMLLLAEKEGTQATYDIDNEDVVGKLHKLLLERVDVQEMLPGHRRGRQLKSYLTENPDYFDSEDDLYHPKVGVLLKKSLNNGNAFDWHKRDELCERIDETIVNALAWSGIPTQAGGTTFVSDDHFQATAAEEPVAIYDDPTPQMEAEQQSVLITALQSMTDADSDIIESLVTDGGRVHPEELADRTGYGLSTIYRALQRLDGVLENAGASVRFTSRKIADEIQGIVESAEYQIENAAKRVEALLGMETRQAASGAFQAWLNRYAGEVEIEERGDDETLRIRVDTILSTLKSRSAPHVQEVVRELLEAWDDDGRDVRQLRDAYLEYKTGPGDRDVAPLRTLL